MSLRSRLKNLAISLDQFLFCIVTLGGSMPDETASAAAWLGEQKGQLIPCIARPVIDWLASPWEADHCFKSYMAEQQRTQSPPPLQQQRGTT